MSRAQMASFVMHDLGLQIAGGVAYFGGAFVALEPQTVPWDFTVTVS